MANLQQPFGADTLYCIVYASTATEPFTKEQLAKLLLGSRARNAKRGVTGMLLYKGGNFMHCIEGEKPVVEALFAKVSADPRHYGIIVLLREERTERQFPDYSVGFRDLNDDEPRHLEGYSEFLNSELTDSDFQKNPSKAKRLLAVFKQSMR
ncbi:MAG: BLUF domain-containing protein [Planctomycetota bacterium]